MGWPVKYKRFNKGQVFLDQPEQVRSNTTVNFPHTGMVEKAFLSHSKEIGL